MSRTDKDRPYRVRAADPLEPGRYETHYHAPRMWGEWTDDCDLGEHPYAGWRDPDHDVCTYHIAGWAFAPYRHSPPEARRAWGHKPDRARTRARLERIRAEFNAGEDIEGADVFSPQARHSVDWMWA